jgi:membrane associated rhomboid family serine protease
MKKFLNEIRMQFGNATSLYRLMAINIGVFLFFTLIRTFLFLFQVNDSWLDLVINKLSLPSDFGTLITQPWSLVTYMFLHEGIMHIVFNMLVFYWMGKLLTEYLGNDKLWTTYLLGGLTGGLLYILAFNLFPAFETVGQVSRLLGASAGVIAILIAAATLLPDYLVHLMIFGEVKLKYVAIASILLYAISIPYGNAGGHIAHLGGALFGFTMIKFLRNGTDITTWLAKLGNRNKSKSNLRVVSRSKRVSDEEFFETKRNSQENIDRILDKINRSGFDSLTGDEKEFLYKASGKK